ncbi:hypothetical protein ACFQJD_10780 [Haloplanus sp. GCM10025708]|uniref:hypothetical protein n=1 Tax=Haloferacaceae TaxID=1644056 RepID=UPI0036227035
MTRDTPISLSRRTLLAGLGTAGVAAIGAGLGTAAFLSDGETARVDLVAGALDLTVDWEERYVDGSGDEAAVVRPLGDGDAPGPGEFVWPFGEDRRVVTDLARFADATAVEASPDANDDGRRDATPDAPCDVYADVPSGLSSDLRTRGTVGGHRTESGDPLLDLPDVKPGDSGSLTLSYHLCGNPGYVWMQGELLGDDENGIVDSEMGAHGEDGTAAGELADELLVTVWDDDGDGVPGDDEPLIVSGALSSVAALLNTGHGIPFGGGAVTDLTGVVAVGDGGGTLTLAAESPTPGYPTCGDRGLLRALDVAAVDLSAGTYETPVGDVTVTAVQPGVDGVASVDVTAAFPMRAVVVAGEEAANVYESADGATSGSGLSAPDPPDGDPGTIRRIAVCYAGEPADGTATDRSCFAADSGGYVGIGWWLPRSVGNAAQSDSVAFDVGFYAEQCRHKDGAGAPTEPTDTGGANAPA